MIDHHNNHATKYHNLLMNFDMRCSYIPFSWDLYLFLWHCIQDAEWRILILCKYVCTPGYRVYYFPLPHISQPRRTKLGFPPVGCCDSNWKNGSLNEESSTTEVPKDREDVSEKVPAWSFWWLHWSQSKFVCFLSIVGSKGLFGVSILLLVIT